MPCDSQSTKSNGGGLNLPGSGGGASVSIGGAGSGGKIEAAGSCLSWPMISSACPEPIEVILPTQIVIASQGVVDDDLAVRIDGVMVFDTQYNTSWYKGEDFVTKNIPPYPPYNNPEYWRVARVTRDMALAAGVIMQGGMVVEVFTFDGWGDSWITEPWVATVTWSDGSVTTHSGGSSRSGASSGTNPPSPPSPFSYGPHFISYIPNGSFVI